MASAVYNYNIGKPVSTTDVNGNTTTYGYSTGGTPDAFDRLTSILRPDGGSTTFAYSDTPGAISVTSNEAQTSAGPIVTTTQYDTLGRKSSTALSEGAGSSIVTTYGYDGRGRQNCVSLPFRGSPAACSSSIGTTTAYDAMNRPVQVTEADGSTSVTAYLGNQTVVKDPAGFVRLSVADFAGRLTTVQENPTAWASSAGSFPSGIAGMSGQFTYTTSYGYDLLNNLLSVSQTDPTSSVTLSRSFAYDSLKRLVRATNPENGQINYQYDASGNLSSRADASRTVSYGAYDGLNRAASKSYSDGVTPAVTYTYGDQSYPAC
jgi:YD repeat-containing protein